MIYGKKRVGECVLHMTCPSTPEQYDVYLGENQIGYLRLRSGWFRADYGGCGGPTVYEADPEGDGQFMAHERDAFLSAAVDALLKHHNDRNAPDLPNARHRR